MGDKPLGRSNSNTWRAWRRTTIRIFVGLNILLIVGFYVATSSFHGGLSHLDGSDQAGHQDQGRPGTDLEICQRLALFTMQVAALWRI